MRAADYEPEDTWTRFFIGDLKLRLGDVAAATESYHLALAIAEAFATRDPANTEWQRDLSVSHDRIGNVLVAQGEGPGTLATYRKGLAIAEALAARDPANSRWQTDLALAYSKLGPLDHGQCVETRRDHLMRGKAILLKLKSEGRLAPAGQDRPFDAHFGSPDC